MATRVSKDSRIFAFARGMTPAATVDAGETVLFEANDCYDGQVDLAGAKASTDKVDKSRINPATGPVFVDGAKPGDMLVAHIERIDVAPRGVIFGSSRDYSHREGRVIDIDRGHAVMPGGFRFPIDPIVGVIGVAPVGDSVDNSTPGNHGGNLDTRDVNAGSTVYLPVAEEGGMFALGDLHALQGDGEVCGQGVEIAGEVTVRLQVMKGRIAECPVIRTATHWAVMGAAETLDEAVDIALLRARELVMAMAGVKDHEAIMLLSAVADVRISQIVNPLRAVRVCIPGSLAPAW